MGYCFTLLFWRNVYMKNFFDALDRLYESGQPSMSEAISALQRESPELSSHKGYAKYAVASWMHKYGN